MRRRFPLLAALVLILVSPALARAASLESAVDYAIARADLGGAAVAVSVREAGGSPLVDLGAGTPMIPASNLKLLTTGAALATLGPEFRFRTRLLRRGDRLVVVGDGDPGFGDPVLLAAMTPPDRPDGPGLDVEEFLDLWADAVVATGLEHVSSLLVDDRIFDREFVHPTWPSEQLNRRYCAQVSGLSFHLNRLHFYPVPRSGKRPNLSEFHPRLRSLSIENNATSLTGVHDDDTVWIARRMGTNQLTFYGNVKHRYRTPVPVTVHDMPSLFATLLGERLEAAGITVDETGVCDGGAPESEGDPVGPVITTPIATAVTRCNRDSQNLYAECLLKRLGRAMTGQPGSFQNGAAIVRHVVHHRLADTALTSNMVIADGSGLSRENRVAPATMTAWLAALDADEAIGPVFRESLAVGGSSGTLENRLRGARDGGALVQAKSGYINGVSCLSGFVTDGDGRRRVFSIMVNDLRAPVARAKRLQDAIVRLIFEDMEAVEAAAAE